MTTAEQGSMFPPEEADPYGGLPSPDAAPDKPFEIGDELPIASSADDEDAEMASMFTRPQTPAGEDDDLVIDWDEERGLLEKGVHPFGRLANVEKGTTSQYAQNPGEPAIIWSVTDAPTNRTCKKTVPMQGDSNIPGMNVDFARIFGVEPKQIQVRGKTKYSLKLSELRKCIGLPCAFEVDHFGSPPRDSLKRILPAQSGPSIDVPDDSYPEG